MAKLFVFCFIAFLILASCLARTQDVPGPSVFLPDQEVRVSSLSVHPAPSPDSTAVLRAALETIFHNPNICCGKSSALEDAVSADSRSLQEIATKLQGRHLLSDGRPITVTAEYVPPNAMNSGQIIGSLTKQQALLMGWRSHFYVLYGAVFNETRYDSGIRDYAIHKLLLSDPRFADARRDTVFNRDTDDLSKVQGLLVLSVSPQ